MQAATQKTGFTLIEILVAVTVFSILIITLFSAFRAFLSSSRAIKAQTAVETSLRPCIEQMTRDIEQIVVLQPPRYQPPEVGGPLDPHRFVGREYGSGGQGFSEVSFSSLNHALIGPDLRRGAARISYYARQNSDQGYDLCRSDRLDPGDREPAACQDPVLLKNITGFSIRFMDARGKEHLSWDSESGEFGYAFPASLDLKLSFQIDRSFHVFETSISLFVKREGLE